jgi:hypothetical protein
MAAEQQADDAAGTSAPGESGDESNEAKIDRITALQDGIGKLTCLLCAGYV